MAMISRERRDRLKSVLIRFPILFRTVRGTYLAYAKLGRELFALLHFGPRLITKGLGSSDAATTWERELPVQQPASADAAAVTPTLNPQQIKAWCSARQLPFCERANAIYLPPATWRATPLAGAMPDYPVDAGLKIIKHASDTRFRPARSGSGPAHAHHLQILTINYLHLQGITPRLYDLIELRDGSGVVWTGYVMEHIEAAPLQQNDHSDMMATLRALVDRGPLKLAEGIRWDSADFRAPDCASSLLRDRSSGKLRYVDTHDFCLEEYEKYLRGLAIEVTETSHFGGRSRFLGGKEGAFLYQEIPGLHWPAKRSPEARLQAWDPLLQRAGVSIENKVIFDIGCNLGLMGAEYLRRGARWIHGWDRSEVVEAANKVLLSIGCTRFSLSGGALGQSSDLAADLPPHLKALGYDAGLLSYLSVRDHIGWLPALSDLPWRYMLYEGHQDDRQIETYVADLNARIPVRLLTTDRVSDGVSAPRDIALIERLSR